MKIVRRIRVAALCAVAIGSCAPPVFAGQLNKPNWDATLAMQTASLQQGQARVENLFTHVRDADHASLNLELDELISGSSLSQPLRDAILFRFTVGLADFDHIDARIIDRLRQVKPRTFVSHEERAGVGVPLFNIAGAAEGLHHLQARRTAMGVASATLGAPAPAWVDAYLDSSRSEQRGFTDALGNASDQELRGILESSLERLSAARELTPVAGKSALLLGDVEALQQVAISGAGAELGRILEAAGHTLPRQDVFSLLEFAVAHASAVNASLAIAQLYSQVSSLPEASDLLFSTLGNSKLGPAAALALAESDNQQARQRLLDIAREENGLASDRARIALGRQGGLE